MRVKKWKKYQSFLAMLIMGVSLFVPWPSQAQELQLKLPDLNLPRPIEEQQQDNDNSTINGQTEQNQESNQQQSVAPTQNNPEINNLTDVPTEKNTSPSHDGQAQLQNNSKQNNAVQEIPSQQTPAQMPQTLENKSDEATKQVPEQAQPNIEDNGTASNEQKNAQEPISTTSSHTTSNTPSSNVSDESVSTTTQSDNNASSDANTVSGGTEKDTQNNADTQTGNNVPTHEAVSGTTVEGDQTAGSNPLEAPINDENNPVVGIIDTIVKQRNPALKVDASRNDIFRFVSTERKGATLIYHAAAPSLVTSPEWDGLTMTTIMCKEQRLRPAILDGKAAIKVEMNVVDPAGDYTFVADAHSCKQLTPDGDTANVAIEQPDLVANALAAEAKRLSLFGCLKNDSTEILENCSLGMVPRTSWEWQLQDVTTDQRKVMMTYLNTDDTFDESEINRVINRTCAKEEIHSIIELGAVYDITVTGKSKKSFLIDKQACDQSKE